MKDHTEAKPKLNLKQKRKEDEGNEAVRLGASRKFKRSFIYGNYNGYYGYRIDQALDEDPRLKVLKKAWFEGKDCLDIGCNEGFITISIAQKFSCRSMLGVDIDDALIGRARRHLKRLIDAEEDGETVVQSSDDKKTVNDLQYDDRISFGDGVEDLSTHSDSDSLERRFKGVELLKRVRFRTENFVEKFHSKPDETYDTVLCLSVTKWVHLNWGDEGLIHLFAKIWRVLRPGGILVLEPQPWISYKKKHRVSEVPKYSCGLVQFCWLQQIISVTFSTGQMCFWKFCLTRLASGLQKRLVPMYQIAQLDLTDQCTYYRNELQALMEHLWRTMFCGQALNSDYLRT